MKIYEEPQYDDFSANADFSGLTDKFETYSLNSDKDEDEDDDEKEEVKEIPDNDWGDVDPQDNPLRIMPDPMDPSGPGSAV